MLDIQGIGRFELSELRNAWSGTLPPFSADGLYDPPG